MLIKLQDPSFDSWTIVFLFIAFQGIITAIGFGINSKGQKYANRFIAMILFSFAISLIAYAMLWTGYIKYFPYMGIVEEITALIFGPLFYFYFVKLIKGRNYPIRYWLHFIPAFSVLIYLLPPFFFDTKEQIISYLNNPIYSLLPWIKIAHLFIYGIRSYLTIIEANFLREMKKWANSIALFYAGFVLTLVSYYFLLNFSDSYKWNHAIYFCMSAFICFTALFAYIQPKIFDGYAMNELNQLFFAQKYKSSGLTPSAINELFENLQNLMKEEHLYRENDIRLDTLSKRLNSNRHHLSQVINEKTGGNFFDYINSLRINEAMELLKTNEKKELNIIEIAYIVGYNNKVSFNNSFKKFAGITPTEYRLRE